MRDVCEVALERALSLLELIGIGADAIVRPVETRRELAQLVRASIPAEA